MKDIIRYAEIIENDTIDEFGICVSLSLQRCNNDYCSTINCNFNAGTEINAKKLSDIILNYINRDDTIRNFSVLGAEPFCPENIDEISYIINRIRDIFKNIEIFVWTNNTYENLYKQIPINESVKSIFDNIDYLIDGPYMNEQKNPTLFLRKSENQRVIDIKKMRELNSWNDIILYEK